MNDKCSVIIEKLIESFAALFVGLDNLYIHVFGHGFNGSYGCTSATHHHDILHIYIVFFAYNLSNERYVLASCHEICHVIELKFIVSTRYNRIAIALDCHDMVRIIRATDIFQRPIEYLT